ncbi:MULTISPECIES: hypothetical protein [unclassified Exiguobacterium]|uniref:hypothetical protein n=1 Tax=unclassified Exiguobacterium TaxID=2644629 RepID=UPI0025B83681|nr:MULTISPECIES: hypothetical protein [unclassified Exiguobacterium]
MIQGQYRFSNDTLINTINTKNENYHIVKHEYIHKVLSGATSYGLLLVMIEKASFIDNSKKWLFDELIDLCSKMQEQVATFLEYIHILEVEGLEKYKEKREELRLFNKRYYNFFYAIEQYVSVENLNKEKIEELSLHVLNYGILAMNVDIEKVPLNDWKNKKDVHRFFSDQNNSISFNPNKRFEIIIKKFLAEKTSYDEKIQQVLHDSFLEDLHPDYVIKIMIKLYEKSHGINRIMKRLSGFDNFEEDLDPKDLSLISAFPMKNDKAVPHSINSTNLKTIFSKLGEDNKNTVLFFQHLISGLEEMSLLSCLYLNEAKLLTSYYKMEDIIKIIKNIENPVIFIQGKLYRMVHQELLEECSNRKVYIAMDNALNSSLKVIEDLFCNAYYITIPVDDFEVVAIYKNNHILLQPVIKEIRNVINRQLSLYHILPASFSEYLSFDKKEIEKISRALFELSNLGLQEKDFGF